MRRLLVVLITFLATLVLLSAAQLSAQQTLTPEQVEALRTAGFTDQQIAAMILGQQPPVEKSLSGLVVPRKTLVHIRVDELLTSKDSKVGPFRCVADEEVKVDGKIVIAEGAEAVCRVVAIEKGGFSVKKDTVKIAADSVLAVDGAKVILDYEENHGGSRMGFGGLRTGVKIKAGTILPAVVGEEARVKIPSLTAKSGVK